MILGLHRKSELVQAIDLYRLYDPETPLRIAVRSDGEAQLQCPETHYRRTQRAEVLLALERAGVLKPGQQEGFLELVTLENENSVSIPKFDYSQLSATAIKLLIACHAEVRNRPKREAFRFVATQPDLAKMAGISEKEVTDALRQLERFCFLERWPHNQRRQYVRKKIKPRLASLKRRNPAEYRKLMRKVVKRYGAGGTKITLLDPGSGADLFWLGTYFAARESSLPPMLRYQMCLESHDPKGTLSTVCTELRNYLLNCPFCRAHKKFSITYTEEGADHWKCFNCGEAGDSLRLVHMLGGRRYTHWREIIPEQNAVPVDWKMETGVEMNARQMISGHLVGGVKRDGNDYGTRGSADSATGASIGSVTDIRAETSSHGWGSSGLFAPITETHFSHGEGGPDSERENRRQCPL
jgi:hypothetical protein